MNNEIAAKALDMINELAQFLTNNIKPEVSEKSVSETIENKLRFFEIEAKVISIIEGPVVDTYELKLGEDVKVSSVVNRCDDLSIAFKGKSVRIIYPMQGKSTVGLEVAKDPREIIHLADILKSEAFLTSEYKIPIVLGKDTYGIPAITDLSTTPHLLIAGTTGAGKSNFVNTILVSLISKFSADKMRLLLIDPKQISLNIFQGIPIWSCP